MSTSRWNLLSVGLRRWLRCLSVVERRQLREAFSEALAARRDPCQFIRYCFVDGSGQPLEPAGIHRELQAFLSQHRHALIELPRDHGKSTQVCGRILWELGHNPNLRVKIVCATESIAAERSRFLREAIEWNRRVRLVFPSLRPSSPWADEGFTVEREASILGPSVSAVGVGSASTGTRADLLVCDDVVDARALSSRVQRQRVRQEFEQNLMNLLEPDGRFWGLFTPWHADDLNAHLVRNGSFAHYRRAIDSQLTPLWPEKWPRERLQARLREIGLSAFARGYHLVPLTQEEAVIRGEWVQVWTEPARYERVVVAVDPAVGTSASADRTGVVAVGEVLAPARAGDMLLSLGGREFHILSARARRTTPRQLVQLLDEMDRLYAPEVILVEGNGGFQALTKLLVPLARFGGKLKTVTTTRSKSDRVAAFSVPVENGVVRLKGRADGRIDPSQRELFEEMVTFPTGRHDDLLDATALAVSYLLERRSPRVFTFDATGRIEREGEEAVAPAGVDLDTDLPANQGP